MYSGLSFLFFLINFCHFQLFYLHGKQKKTPNQNKYVDNGEKDEFFTLLIFKDITARHSGKYTCFPTNSAAKVNYTAELLVRCKYHLAFYFNLL